MHSSNREKDARHSGTGIYYQAIPAVGADGKNIMKLIPVQKVNGQFFQTDLNKPRTDPTPQKGVTTSISSAPEQLVKKVSMSPLATQHIFREALSRPVELDHGYSLNKHSPKQQTVSLTAKVPPTPASNCGKSVRRPCQLPVTVKSPALPKGHCILIPPNAQVQTVPASELPPGIKKQIFVSSGNSAPGPSRVVYVSPVTTVNQGATPPTDSAVDSLKLKTICNSKPHLKLIPKVSQRPNSPIKWVIEEEESSTARHLNPLNSSSVTSEILRAVAERETSRKHCDVIGKTASQSILGKSGQGQENALVMCNGKVFFLAKKCSLPFKMGQSDPSASTTVPSVEDDLRIVISDESDDVIDLCDDDDATQEETSLDEDNVIFVSYIPPKSESASLKNVMLKSQMELEKEKVQLAATESNSLTDGKQLDGRDERSPPRGREPGQSNLISTSVCSSAVMNMHEDPHVKSQQNTSTQQVKSVEVDAETENPADPSTSDSSSRTCSQKEKDTHNKESYPDPATGWTASLAPTPCQKTDHLLRKIFGITADVNVSLHRVDETSAWSVLAQPLQNKTKRSAEDHQEPTNSLQELYESSKRRETDNYSGLINIKRVKLRKESELSADPATPTPRTDVPLRNNCHSGQRSLCGTSCDGESAPVSGYVEPIDEDFPSTNEDDIPNSKTCVEMSTNTRRIGRTRKPTTCPCCTTGSLDHTVKSSIRSEEPEKCAWTTEQIRTKEGRTKTPGKTSGKISCVTAKSKKYRTYEFPASENLNTTSTDFKELEYDEQIEKLRELLKEKEKSLELTRNRMR
uniref:Ligand dependent nuclear receptor interacting factor 1 n=1 Tax=Anabas testudineus TaxID=64144 RepID=A0A3Q1JNM3_ANATE